MLATKSAARAAAKSAAHAATKSTARVATAESTAASESAAVSMTATAATMSGGQGIGCRCRAERHGDKEDDGPACGGLLPDVLNGVHGRCLLWSWERRNGC
jgi:hypothetical protein